MKQKRQRKRLAVALTLPANLPRRIRRLTVMHLQRLNWLKRRMPPPMLPKTSRRRRSRTRMPPLTHRAHKVPPVMRDLDPPKKG